MVQRYCRRRWWVRAIRWSVCAAILFLVLWRYKAWVVHGVNFLSSPPYRECVSRRHQMNAANNMNRKQELFLTTELHGRLGNWLYQYASLLGIAKANGFTPYFLNFHSLSYSFQLSHLRSSSAECLDIVPDPKPMSYVDSFNHLPKSNISIDGYLQSWKYFRSISDEIRTEFRFRSAQEAIIRHKFDTYVGRHVREGREVISVHVRRGDVVSSGAKRLGFKPATAAYFANAMRYMVQRHPYCVFLIISDDMDWCRENIGTVLLKYYNEENDEDNGDDKKKSDKIISPSSIRLKNIFVVNVEDGSEEPIIASSAKNTGKLFEKIRDVNNNNNDDDIDNDNNNKNNDRNVVYLASPPLVLVPPDSSIVDLGLLTLANHSVMSVGTFGWWGAWLAGGDVVYYQDWPERDHQVYSQWTKEDYFPPHWVALSKGCGLNPDCGRVVVVLLLVVVQALVVIGSRFES